MTSLHDKLVPYVLTFGPNEDFLRLNLSLSQPLRVLRFEDPANEEFTLLANRGNRLAFGGANMGMPLWVMLDCAILPTAICGFMLDAADVSDELAADLELDDDYEGWVPVSEYCAAKSVEPGCVSGFSMHAHVPGQGLATRSKALALAVLGARSQIGVTQFTNPAIRVHSRFGPMEILVHRPSAHTHSDDSFVYRLELPDRATLEALARDPHEFGVADKPSGMRWTFDPSDELAHGRLRSHLADGGRAWIVAPGWRGTEDGCELDLVLGA